MKYPIKENEFLTYKKKYSSSDIRELIEKNNLIGLKVFSVLKEDEIGDVDFLEQCSFLKALAITVKPDVKLGAINRLRGIKYLSLSYYGNEEIDLSGYDKLETLIINWRKTKIKGIEQCKNLKNLMLIEFKEKDLSHIEKLKKLETLEIKTGSLKSLSCIDRLKELKIVKVGNCRSLTSINNLSGLKNLSLLKFDSCRKIEDSHHLHSLDNLKELNFTNCGEIESISFLKALKSLRVFKLIAGTVIKDGNLKPALNIEEVIYHHEKHYNIRIENKEHEALRKQNLKMINQIFK